MRRILSLAAALAVLGPAPLVAQEATGPATPLAGYTLHVVATHWPLPEGEPYTSHHWFKAVEEGFFQGINFLSDDPAATVVEIEWAIGAERWRALPERERAHWHPLAPAVAAGRIEVRGVDEATAAETLQAIAGLYAQTIAPAGVEGRPPSGLADVVQVTHLAPEERAPGEADPAPGR